MVLIVDFWHPDLTDEEVKFLSFLNKGQVAAATRLNKLQQQQLDATSESQSLNADSTESTTHQLNNQPTGSFLGVILAAQGQGGVDEAAIWPYDVRDD